MRKCNSSKSSPGVEQEPKRIERAHSGTRKLHRYLNFDERIHQWEVSSISSENSFLFSTLTLENIEKEAKTPVKKKRNRTGINTLIFFCNSFEPYASKGACTVLQG